MLPLIYVLGCVILAVLSGYFLSEVGLVLVSLLLGFMLLRTKTALKDGTLHNGIGRFLELVLKSSMLIIMWLTFFIAHTDSVTKFFRLCKALNGLLLR